MDKQTEYCITKGMILEMIANRIREGYSTDKDMFLYLAKQIRELDYDENPIKEPRFLIIDYETGNTAETFDTLAEAMEGYNCDTEYIYDSKDECKVNPFNLNRLSR